MTFWIVIMVDYALGNSMATHFVKSTSHNGHNLSFFTLDYCVCQVTNLQI